MKDAISYYWKMKGDLKPVVARLTWLRTLISTSLRMALYLELQLAI